MVGPMTKREIDVAVDGGNLRVAVWEPDGAVRGEVVAVHGITSSHLAWQWLADAAPDLRIVAPDLRGRGRSQEVAPGQGMATHADDLAAVVETLGLDRPVLLGHSMGAFVSVVAAHRHPDIARALILVDGGLPLGIPEGVTADQAMTQVLGPTAQRLQMRFADVDAYLDFWHQHPAFTEAWCPELEDYFAYDLVPADGALRPATSYDTTARDTEDLIAGEDLPRAWKALALPTWMLTVPRGLTDQPPGLYPEPLLAPLLEGTDVRHTRNPDFNHYTITMTPEGAATVAELLDDALLATPVRGGQA